MVEIIALLTLTKKMAALATKKGLKPGTWKLYMILAWFGTEIVGFLATFLITNDRIISAVVGWAVAIASYFVVRNILSKKPDVDDNWINQIGAQPTDLPAQ